MVYMVAAAFNCPLALFFYTIPYDTVISDPTGCFDVATSIFTAKQRGLYLVTATMLCDVTALAATAYTFRVRSNILPPIFDQQTVNHNVGSETLMIDCLVPLEVGGQIYAQYMRNAGAANNIFGGAAYTRLMIQKLSEL